MKVKVLSFLSFIMVCFSCSSDTEETEPRDLLVDSYPQEWVLFEAMVAMSGEIVTEDELEWQEEYDFQEDGSFSKVRISAKDKISASGTFQRQQEEDGTVYLILTYDDDDSLVNSCGYGNQEWLSLDLENSVLENNGWLACDGPGLYYKRKE